MASNSTNVQIQFQYLDVETCFKNFYVVPDYQREYVWGEQELLQLLEDVYDEFGSGISKEYFIGSTVVFKNANGLYELIDGQQRTTSIFLILCAFKKIMTDRTMTKISVGFFEKMIREEAIDSLGNSLYRYKLELQYKDSSKILEKIANNLTRPPNLNNSADRLFAAYENSITFINEKFTKDDELHAFFIYFFRKLKFIQIETPEINDALKIFETINQRGVGLNSMDLLKNLLFRQVDRNEFNKLKSTWQNLIQLLEKNNEKPLRFLRYFIMSNYKVNNLRGEEVIREDEIYNWFIKADNIKQCDYVNKPFEFVDQLMENANSYINFIKGQNIDGSKNVNLDNIVKLGGRSFKQHLILLLAARNLDQDQFNNFTKQLETLIFYYFITKEQTKEFERIFSKWAKEILNVKSETELKDFVKKNIEPVVTAKEAEYKIRFLEAGQKNLQKHRILYILAKIAQYLDQQHRGTYVAQTLDSYLTKGVELEHILPFNPDLKLRSEIGTYYDDLKIRLGNLTLLEKVMNIVVGNDFYKHKVIQYEKSPFYISKSLAKLDSIGKNTSVTKLNLKLRSYTEWNKVNILDRQEMLYNLSRDIWQIDC
jgi:uncharacterized protein with ParB-like and HNH nuclease domain